MSMLSARYWTVLSRNFPRYRSIDIAVILIRGIGRAAGDESGSDAQYNSTGCP
jgi:hypothetical protein